MLIRRSLLVTSFFTTVCLTGTVGFASTKKASAVCRGPDNFSASQIAHLQALMASTDPRDSTFLRDVHLPHVASNLIQLVTADSVCSLALHAWTTADTLTTPPLTSLYVIQVGPMYDAIDAQHSGGEYSQHLVLDSLFNFQAPYLF
jgi:hypothetical protein